MNFIEVLIILMTSSPWVSVSFEFAQPTELKKFMGFCAVPFTRISKCR